MTNNQEFWLWCLVANQFFRWARDWENPWVVALHILVGLGYLCYAIYCSWWKKYPPST